MAKKLVGLVRLRFRVVWVIRTYFPRFSHLLTLLDFSFTTCHGVEKILRLVIHTDQLKEWSLRCWSNQTELFEINHLGKEAGINSSLLSRPHSGSNSVTRNIARVWLVVICALKD